MHGHTFRTRFAPSPSGLLHLGHAYASLNARALADEHGGECLLRIEDVDTTRCKAAFIDAIVEDMDWLGICFDGEIVLQSERLGLYADALERLKGMEVVYPCFCSRKEIAAELEELGRAPQGEQMDPYPGTCKRMSPDERDFLISQGKPHSWRLDCRKVAEMTGVLPWHDMRFGDQLARPESIGDIILGRKDCAASYHIAVVTDDAAQGISHVCRGEDLLPATHLHRTLQALLGLDVPVWFHHPLIADSSGKRLAKRNNSLSVRQMRENGMTREMVFDLLNKSVMS